MNATPAIDDVDTYVRSRESLHAVAEHVVSPARFRVDRKIGLRSTSGGFGTPVFGDDEQVRVDGTELVHTAVGREQRSALTALAAAAEAVGLAPGTLEVYAATTPLEPAAPLAIDAASARVIAWCFETGAAVLEQLRADPESHPDGAVGADAPSVAQIWPEHFDLATDLGAPGSRANFGLSPGDAGHAEPYLYVGPWDAARIAPDTDAYWNESFGASLPYSALRAAPNAYDAALAFFRRGRGLLNS